VEEQSLVVGDGTQYIAFLIKMKYCSLVDTVKMGVLSMTFMYLTQGLFLGKKIVPTIHIPTTPSAPSKKTKSPELSRIDIKGRCRHNLICLSDNQFLIFGGYDSDSTDNSESTNKKGAGKKAESPSKGVFLLQLDPPKLKELGYSQLGGINATKNNFFQLCRAGASVCKLPSSTPDAHWFIFGGFDGQNKLTNTSALLSYIPQ